MALGHLQNQHIIIINSYNILQPFQHLPTMTTNSCTVTPQTTLISYYTNEIINSIYAITTTRARNANAIRHGPKP